jgi:ABC-2 type transport system ATP-binding protein
VDQALEALDLDPVARRRVGNLSQGYRQRTALAQALVHDPELLILDEPTAGLDPAQAAALRHRLQALRAHRAIVFSTHLAEDLRDGCDRVLALRAGRLVGEVDRQRHARTLWLRLERPPTAEALLGVHGVEDAQPVGKGGFRVTLAPAASADALLAAVLSSRWVLREWRTADPGLDLLLEQSS